MNLKLKSIASFFLSSFSKSLSILHENYLIILIKFSFCSYSIIFKRINMAFVVSNNDKNSSEEIIDQLDKEESENESKQSKYLVLKLMT